jgi:hypothetical protein
MSTRQLVFFLYELPPPLGRRSARMDMEAELAEENQNSKTRKEERYMVNYEKGIVLRKREALALLKDLKIKVNKASQVHFVDVFKALIKRIFDDKGHDYKLSPNLNKKIKAAWTAKGKDAKQTYPTEKFTASQQQAGQIIVKWLESRFTRIKATHNRLKTRQATKEEKSKGKADDTSAQKMLKEQARIIQNIIECKDDEDDDSVGSGDKGRQRLKWDEQRWKKPGGDRLLANLENDYWSELDNAEESEGSWRGLAGRDAAAKITTGGLGDSKDASMTQVDKSADGSRLLPEKIAEAQSESERSEKDEINEKPIRKAQKQDEFAGELFGPQTKKIVQTYKER